MKLKMRYLVAPIAMVVGLTFLSGCNPQGAAEAQGTGSSNVQAKAEAQTAPKPKKKVETIDDLSDFFPKPLGSFRVSMLGGGTSHDFDRWFNVSDSVTLSYASTEPINYTTNLTYFLEGLPKHDVLYFCNNSPMTNAELNKAIFDFADKGGAFLMVHPSLWYNWKDWPEWNKTLIGGGSKKHDKYGPIEVVIDKRDHPIMHNIPKSFKVSDELYHFEADPAGSPIEVLATGINPETGSKFPVVWITKHPKAKIICTTLGHDGSTHENVAFRVMLQNCMAWVAGSEKVLLAGGEWTPPGTNSPTSAPAN